MKCSYPSCNKKAEVTLSMNDPDSEKIPYCDKCADKIKVNTFLSFIKQTIKNGVWCKNEK